MPNLDINKRKNSIKQQDYSYFSLLTRSNVDDIMKTDDEENFNLNKSCEQRKMSSKSQYKVLNNSNTYSSSNGAFESKDYLKNFEKSCSNMATMREFEDDQEENQNADKGNNYMQAKKHNMQMYTAQGRNQGEYDMFDLREKSSAAMRRYVDGGLRGGAAAKNSAPLKVINEERRNFNLEDDSSSPQDFYHCGHDRGKSAKSPQQKAQECRNSVPPAKNLKKSRISEFLRAKPKQRVSLLYRFSSLFGLGGDAGNENFYFNENNKFYECDKQQSEREFTPNPEGAIKQLFYACRKWIYKDDMVHSNSVVATRINLNDHRNFHSLKDIHKKEQWIKIFDCLKNFRKKEILLFFVLLFLLFYFINIFLNFFFFLFDLTLFFKTQKYVSTVEFEKQMNTLRLMLKEEISQVNERIMADNGLGGEVQYFSEEILKQNKNYYDLIDEVSSMKYKIEKTKYEHENIRSLIYNLTNKLEQKIGELDKTIFSRKEVRNAEFCNLEESESFVKLRKDVEELHSVLNNNLGKSEKDKKVISYARENKKPKEYEECGDGHDQNNISLYKESDRDENSEKEGKKSNNEFVKGLSEDFLSQLCSDSRMNFSIIHEKLENYNDLVLKFFIGKAIDDYSGLGNERKDERNRLEEIIKKLETSIKLSLEQKIIHFLNKQKANYDFGELERNKNSLYLFDTKEEYVKKELEEQDYLKDQVGSEKTSVILSNNVMSKDFQIKQLLLDLHNEVWMDGNGLIDWALDSLGAKIVHSHTSPALNTDDWLESMASSIARNFDGLYGLAKPMGKSAEIVLRPNVHPGNCFAFKGSQGNVTIQLPATILINSVSIDHVMSEINNNLKSTPKVFSVFAWVDKNFFTFFQESKNKCKKKVLQNTKNTINGLQNNDLNECIQHAINEDAGKNQHSFFSTSLDFLNNFFNFSKDEENEALSYLGTFTHVYPSKQKFHTFNIATPTPINKITFAFKSNYGGSYTCVYRLRVHGTKIKRLH